MNNQKKMDKPGTTVQNQPREEPGKKPTVWIFLSTIIGFIYLLNPTFGILEIIPDNMPLVGNLDEGAAAILVWQGIKGIIQSKKLK